MKKLVIAALLLCFSVMPLAHAAKEGCIAQNAGLPSASSLHSKTCAYVATVPGNIVAGGRWTVEVWWNGVCDRGHPDWIRSGPVDDTSPIGAAWEGSIAAGSCARATALSADSVVAIGEVRPEGLPPVPNPNDVPPLPGEADTPAGCVVFATADAVTCTSVSGAEGSGTNAPEGAVIIGERISWMAYGDWTIDLYDNTACSGTPYNQYNTANYSNAPAPGGSSSNAGVYYSRCAIATALTPGSWVAMGPEESNLLP